MRPEIPSDTLSSADLRVTYQIYETGWAMESDLRGAGRRGDTPVDSDVDLNNMISDEDVGDRWRCAPLWLLEVMRERKAGEGKKMKGGVYMRYHLIQFVFFTRR